MTRVSTGADHPVTAVDENMKIHIPKIMYVWINNRCLIDLYEYELKNFGMILLRNIKG